MEEPREPDAPQTAAGGEVPSALVTGLQNAFTEGLYTDLTIKCGEQSWKVHKLVICSQSDFFKTACNGSFKVSSVVAPDHPFGADEAQEAEEGVINLTDDEPAAVDMLLRYFYHLDYDDESKEVDITPMLLNLHVHAAADKYLVEPLKVLAMEKFISRATTYWCTSSFTDIIPVIYAPGAEDTYRPFKSIILDLIEQHTEDFFTNPDYEDFRATALATPQLLLEHTIRVAEKPKSPSKTPQLSDVTWYKCPGKSCTMFNSTFSVSNKVNPRLWFNCPQGCTFKRKSDFWKEHKIGGKQEEVTTISASAISQGLLPLP